MQKIQFKEKEKIITWIEKKQAKINKRDKKMPFTLDAENGIFNELLRELKNAD